jgi:hypothetical protein
MSRSPSKLRRWSSGRSIRRPSMWSRGSAERSRCRRSALSWRTWSAVGAPSPVTRASSSWSATTGSRRPTPPAGPSSRRGRRSRPGARQCLPIGRSSPNSLMRVIMSRQGRRAQPPPTPHRRRAPMVGAPHRTATRGGGWGVAPSRPTVEPAPLRLAAELDLAGSGGALIPAASGGARSGR